MHTYLMTAAAISLAASLAGCGSATPKRDTYDAINAQIAAAARQAPVTDAAVADALMPPVAALAGQLPKARQALDERFNVAFNNVPAPKFFHSIVAGTRYNMLVHPEVSGIISANLKDVTLIETLDAIREMYGYDYRIDGTRISIRPLTMQTRMFHVNYLVGSRKGSSNLRVSSTSVANAGGSNQGGQNNQNGQNNQGGDQGGANRVTQNDSTNVSTTTASDFWGDLKAALDAIVRSGGKDGGRSVVVSPQSGVLVVRAMPDELRSVDLYLKATQLSVDRQVILEAKILEVELNDSFQSGINWAAFGANGNSRASAGLLSPGTALARLPVQLPPGQAPLIQNGSGLASATGFSLSNAADAANSLFGLAFQTSNFAALISFLESQGTVHVLSSPRVAAMNNEKAVLKIGTDEFFVTGVSTVTNTSAAGNTTSPNVTLTPFFSGVVLDVTPQIDDRGNILLHVHPSVSQVTTVTKSINLGSVGNFNLPLAASSTSEIDSMVRGQNGKVVAIGGLMRQSSTSDRGQIPGAGNLPLVGALFGNRSNVNQKRELVVLIKPTIVEGASSWNADLLDAGRRIEQLDPSARGRK
ncbi:secretin N-terminal domain-containing protein [Massilia sp. TWR1-2-2]|uniref:secretin N-terminal domain-containing protein n=1 Tax=Massilia sp. TWR1-2-2 TaxID=2804584 RepID=UPI003CEB4FE3